MESSEYAIISTGGKQYRVQPGQKLFVATLPGEAGSSVSFEQVLLIKADAAAEVEIGTPYVSGATVKAKIVRHDRSPKVMIFKKMIKQGFTKKQGHRQGVTQVLIESINH